MTPSSLPRSPLTTRLSGSARESRGPHPQHLPVEEKRPPVLVLILAVALITLCGGLVSCQERTQSVALVMDTQYYDTQGNYIEIPALAMSADEQPTEGVAAINQALSQLKAEYQDILDGDVADSSCPLRKITACSTHLRPNAIGIWFSSGRNFTRT